MPDGTEPALIKVLFHINDVVGVDWDACARTANPFVRHAYLAALEDSGSATAETGWLPQHLVLEDASGQVLGAVPLYLKSHSYGEYVFDWGWADALERAGRAYYPKLQCSVPFTPATGPRLLVSPHAPDGTREALVAGMIELAARHGVSSMHVTFATTDDAACLTRAGFLPRTDQQFHWENRDFETFDDFLAALSSRKRKAIARERREVADAGVIIRTLEGAAITEDHWNTFYRFYRATSDRKWGTGYLKRDFFSRVGETMPDSTVLMWAERGERVVAGALNFRGADALYGRWWGADEHVPFLHFELCYYQAIDYAIRHGLKRVEAGAQGDHKLARGYLPTKTHSAHWIVDQDFRQAIARFLDHERTAIAEDIEFLGKKTPFRREDTGRA